MTNQERIIKPMRTEVGNVEEESRGIDVLATAPSGGTTLIDGDMALSLMGQLPDLSPKPTE